MKNETQPLMWSYSFEYDTMEDIEASSFKEAYKNAESDFADKCADIEGEHSIFERTEEVTFYSFIYNDDGIPVYKSQQKEDVTFMREPSDFEEHNVWHKGGVL